MRCQLRTLRIILQSIASYVFLQKNIIGKDVLLCCSLFCLTISSNRKQQETDPTIIRRTWSIGSFVNSYKSFDVTYITPLIHAKQFFKSRDEIFLRLLALWIYEFKETKESVSQSLYWSLFFHKQNKIQVALAGRCRLGRSRSHRRLCDASGQKHSPKVFICLSDVSRKASGISSRFSLMANGFSLEWLSTRTI